MWCSLASWCWLQVQLLSATVWEILGIRNSTCTSWIGSVVKKKKQNQKTDKETAISIRFASIHTSTWQYLIIGFVIVGGVGSRSTQSQRCYIVVAYEKTNYVTSTMLSISEVFGHAVQQKNKVTLTVRGNMEWETFGFYLCTCPKVRWRFLPLLASGGRPVHLPELALVWWTGDSGQPICLERSRNTNSKPQSYLFFLGAGVPQPLSALLYLEVCPPVWKMFNIWTWYRQTAFVSQ